MSDTVWIGTVGATWTALTLGGLETLGYCVRVAIGEATLEQQLLSTSVAFVELYFFTLGYQKSFAPVFITRFIQVGIDLATAVTPTGVVRLYCQRAVLAEIAGPMTIIPILVFLIYTYPLLGAALLWRIAFVLEDRATISHYLRDSGWSGLGVFLHWFALWLVLSALVFPFFVFLVVCICLLMLLLDRSETLSVPSTVQFDLSELVTSTVYCMAEPPAQQSPFLKSLLQVEGVNNEAGLLTPEQVTLLQTRTESFCSRRLLNMSKKTVLTCNSSETRALTFREWLDFHCLKLEQIRLMHKTLLSPYLTSGQISVSWGVLLARQQEQDQFFVDIATIRGDLCLSDGYAEVSRIPLLRDSLPLFNQAFHQEVHNVNPQHISYTRYETGPFTNMFGFINSWIPNAWDHPVSNEVEPELTPEQRQRPRIFFDKKEFPTLEAAIAHTPSKPLFEMNPAKQSWSQNILSTNVATKGIYYTCSVIEAWYKKK